MIFQQIRNATIKLRYPALNILIDPWLVSKGSIRAIESPDEEKNKIMNPMIELPLSIAKIVSDIDICIITHNHLDHFDNDSINCLKKETKIFVQNNDDYLMIKKLGFIDVNLLDEKGTKVKNVIIYKTKGQHGETKQTAEGEVCGVVIKSENEKTIYIAGDTIWYEEIAKTIRQYQPDIIILNACDARLKKTGRLIMNLEDIKKVRENSQNYSIIVSHMDTVNHAYINRVDVKKFIEVNNMKNIYVPDDGEEYSF